MFSNDFFELLKQLLKSWQVIAVTVALVLYMYIVSFVARSYHRPRVSKRIAFKKPKKAEPVSSEGPEETESEHDTNDELGLEEE